MLSLTMFCNTLNKMLPINAVCLCQTGLICILHLMRYKGNPLTRNTALQYFRQSKMRLFELFPVQRHLVEVKLVSMGKTVDTFCMKRDGKVVNKAPPRSKSGLNKMMLHVHDNACSARDYQNAALQCLLWYLFDRGLDLLLAWCSLRVSSEWKLPKSKVSRFTRTPTLSLACPLHAIAMAITMQTAPAVALIDNMPDVPIPSAVNLPPTTPLLVEKTKDQQTTQWIRH
ncbi:Hypothetical protein PHPALM_16810 [Phytophthora palmivora]|uniref:Uncharacterized protein n=1 Tax=Phytophthora palmivora TaxID=4796 RepID=A0A2P4XP13_9STRA|nr:Hypothetical protein PHPALM_16810 [Phytophthora palmivora]